MSTIFFKITETQDAEVKKMMKEEGYANKSEFFRFLIKFYKYNKGSAEREFEIAAKSLADTLREMKKKGKLRSSIDDQLADV